MTSQTTSSLFLMWSAVLSLVEPKVMFQNFTCCLPLSFMLNPDHSHQITINEKTVALLTDFTLEASRPFTVLKNFTLMLDKCLNFSQKIDFINELGFADENRIHFQGLPCPSRAPDPQHQESHVSTGIVIAAVLVPVLVLVLGGIGLVLFLRKRHRVTKSTEGEPEEGL